MSKRFYAFKSNYFLTILFSFVKMLGIIQDDFLRFILLYTRPIQRVWIVKRRTFCEKLIGQGWPVPKWKQLFHILIELKAQIL